MELAEQLAGFGKRLVTADTQLLRLTHIMTHRFAIPVQLFGDAANTFLGVPSPYDLVYVHKGLRIIAHKYIRFKVHCDIDEQKSEK